MHFENKLAKASKLIKINQLSYGRHLDRGHAWPVATVNRRSTVVIAMTCPQWTRLAVAIGHCGPVWQWPLWTDVSDLAKLFIYLSG